MKDNECREAPQPDNTAVRWLSEGLEELIFELGEDASETEEPAFDVVIVGSGYGGALAAAELAGGIDAATGQASRICVLERGREYLAGMFPTSEADLPGSLTLNAPNSPDPYASTDGVLDLRLGEDVSVMLASGLGGGSLINAGVMAIPRRWVFAQPCWPRALRDRRALVEWYRRARALLAPNKKARFDVPLNVKKRAALFRLHPRNAHTAEKLAVTPPARVNSYIASRNTVNAADVPLKECTRCGDCMTGCNHRAKNSLDQNLLVAARRKKVRIVCGATVVSLSRSDEADPVSPFILDIVHTDPLLRRRQQQHFRLKTRRVILAAGTLGSTEILLRSRSEKLKFSSQLGQRFSTNGDFIAASYGEREEVNAVASEFQEFAQREVGPTITSMLRAGRGADQIAIQELAIPGPIRRLFEEGFTTSHLFHRLGTGDPESLHRPRKGGTDPYAVHRDKIARTQALGVMGHDGAKGQLVLRRRQSNDERRDIGWLPLYDTSIAVRWPELRKRPGPFDKQIETLRKLIDESGSGGVFLANPFFQLLPQELTRVLDMPRGPALTTHPLGGCPMADTWHDGVVDQHGQVFNTDQSTSTHPGLVVLDGSMIPTSLAINPAFTISAIVLRALDKLRGDWQRGDAAVKPCEVLPMPDYKTPKPALDVPTEISIRERLTGDLHLESDPSEESRMAVELTLRFEPASARMLATSMNRELVVSEESSKIRVFRKEVLREVQDRGDSEFRCDHRADFVAKVKGTMRLLDRKRSTKIGRVIRALYAWYHNRGKRDAWSALANVVNGSKKSGGTFISGLWSVASHAGEIRLFEYDLEVSDEIPLPPLDPQIASSAGPVNPRGKFKLPPGTRIRGFKRFSYERASNPWKQMLQVELTDFPGLDRTLTSRLELEPKYFARDQKHLFEIVRERDGATGLFELFSFLLYSMRLVAAVHVWSFRKPDTPSTEKPDRLPGELPDTRPPQITRLKVPTRDEITQEAGEVDVVLTRYRKDGAKLPVLLIHGFSASGTTFAHPSLRSGLAKYLYDTGRDVWVVDLRTSSGLASSRRPWSFEQVAREDIPAVVDHITREAGIPKIDVVAHCMGAAMISMALLDRDLKVHEKIRRVVFSQVGPMVSFTAANIFRAYAVSYIQQIFRESNFEFRPSPGIGSAFLDRLLATVPYPREEFEFENPVQPCARTPFTATRHRMDAWFGRVFNIANMDEGVLDHIDDFFGAINLHTSFQTIHFARKSMITTRRGGNAFVIPDQLERLKKVRVFSIHGAKNGLADPATLVRMEMMATEMEIPFRKWEVPDFGHQDCIMGRDAATVVFPQIWRFLKAPRTYEPPGQAAVAGQPSSSIAVLPAELVSGAYLKKVLLSTTRSKFAAQLPFMGPLVGLPSRSGNVVYAIAADPKFAPPMLAVSIPAIKVDENWRADVLEQIRTMKQPWREHAIQIKQPQDTPHWYQITERILDPHTPPASVVFMICNMPAIIPAPWTNYAGFAGKKSVFAAHLEGGKAMDWGALTGDIPVFHGPNLGGIQQLERRNGIAEALERFLCSASLDELQRAQVVLPCPYASEANSLRFAVASCQYPGGPLDPGLASASYARLGKDVDDPELRPRCAVLVGDQIYADATAGIFDPSQLDDRYELPYEAWLQTPAVRDVLRRVPMLAGLDDHEIDNNWEPDLPPKEKFEKRRKMGLGAYFRVQRAAGPPYQPLDESVASPAWYFLTMDGFEFFFTDARSERQKRTIADLHSRRMLGDEQLAQLLAWLDRTSNDRPRFVTSGSILLPRRKYTALGEAGAINSDAWDGYPATFTKLLAHIANRRLRNLVFLSGDEHHSCIATARFLALTAEGKDGPELTTLHSIHSSALNAPFTFANGEPADLAGSDWFSFDNPERSNEFPWPRIGVEVATRFVQLRGDGFAMLDSRRSGADAKWEIECSFSRPNGVESHTIVT